MGLDLAGLWRQADEFLRSHLKSKAVREAEKRRTERRSQEAARRLRRAAVAGGASTAGIAGYAALAAPLAAPALIAAGGGALLLVAVALALPTRRGGGDGDFSRAELAALPGDAEDWLLDRREGLPVGCRPLLDRIFRRLGDLQPHLATLAPHSASAWEARRLLGDHLPRLILAYEAIPPSGRKDDPAVDTRLSRGLTTIADALDALCGEICRDPLMTFETQGRFIETRYRGGSNTPSNLCE